MRILLVEDNPGDVRLLQEALRFAAVDHEFIVAEDGEEALRLVDKGVAEGTPLPRLAILDVNVPRVDGPRVLAHMRATEEWRDIPAIVMSSAESPEVLREVVSVGNAVFYVKPSRLDEFLALGEKIKAVLTNGIKAE
ncbi:MAG: response regulator [Bryobacterales bacterium]|nr:response regulator [Bryobacterales bacterium]